MILTYQKGISPDDGEIIQECRGLVVEVASVGSTEFVSIVAKGFQRFSNFDCKNQVADRFDSTMPFVAQSKEDGETLNDEFQFSNTLHEEVTCNR